MGMGGMETMTTEKRVSFFIHRGHHSQPWSRLVKPVSRYRLCRLSCQWLTSLVNKFFGGRCCLVAGRRRDTSSQLVACRGVSLPPIESSLCRTILRIACSRRFRSVAIQGKEATDIFPCFFFSPSSLQSSIFLFKQVTAFPTDFHERTMIRGQLAVSKHVKSGKFRRDGTRGNWDISGNMGNWWNLRKQGISFHCRKKSM